ncbi:MAG: NAD(P)/FAD-dependent oxidoreductase [Thermoplasmata archaeon]|nr:MAG: NAD(P)/FAD-dependent oxidoreductase [Thermoplasmata archaeon]
MKHYDVIVVGAGPVGGFVADAISKKGYKVALLEEHREIGRPVQCAGLVSHRVFKILDSEFAILNEVRGARVHSPSNRSLLFEAANPKACVIDRAVFDSTLVNKAVDSGCMLQLGAKVIDIKRHNDGIRVELSENRSKIEMECKLVIGSDGVGSQVARNLNFPKPNEILSGYGAECIGDENANKDFVNIFVGNKIAPGFFAWIIPTDEGIRIGLCTSKGKESPKYYFKNLLKNPKVIEIMGNSKIKGYIAGLIPMGPMKKICSDNAMLVGDAAAQVKPLSGGGIYLGLLCGSHCADVAASALENDDVSEKSLKEYPKLVKVDVGKEIKRATQLRKIYVGLKDEHMEEGFNILNDEKVLSFIAKHGDIDYPSGLTKTVLKKAPRLMKFAGPVLKSLL